MSISQNDVLCQEEVWIDTGKPPPPEDVWVIKPDDVPPTYIVLVANGTDPEAAADIVDTTIQATREEIHGELAEPLTMVLGWTYGPDIA